MRGTSERTPERAAVGSVCSAVPAEYTAIVSFGLPREYLSGRGCRASMSTVFECGTRGYRCE